MEQAAETVDARPAHFRTPLLRLATAVRRAFDPMKLLIATLALVALHLGWSLLDLALPAAAPVTPDPIAAASQDVAPWERVNAGFAALGERLAEPVRLVTTPLAALLSPKSGWATMAHGLLGLVWLNVVWGPCGGAIARIAVVEEATRDRPGIGEGVRFAGASAGSLIVAPLCPLLALAFCALAGIALGLVYRVPVVGPVLGSLGLFFPIAAGVVMTLLVAGMVAGWPMLHAALAAGADDALDALSRTFSYLNQRLGLFAAGLAMAAMAGVAGLCLVELMAGGVIHLTQWSVSLSAPRAVMTTLLEPLDPGAPALPGAIHRFWYSAVRLVAEAWIYSFFWTAAAWLYLWLRHDVDGTPWTEIGAPRAPRSEADLKADTAAEIAIRIPGLAKTSAMETRTDSAPAPGAGP
jgi:hypothetical protein